MKFSVLTLLASGSQAIMVHSMVGKPGIRYPGEPYRPPYLEKVAKDLSHNLEEQIPDSIPDEMHHILCMFEEHAGTSEWERLGCDRWIGGNGTKPEKPKHPAGLELDQQYRMTVLSLPESICRQRGF